MSNLDIEINTDEKAKIDANNNFYMLIAMGSIIILILLGFLIYKLIICWLTKWTNKYNKAMEERDMVKAMEEMDMSKIEFGDI